MLVKHHRNSLELIQVSASFRTMDALDKIIPEGALCCLTGCLTATASLLLTHKMLVTHNFSSMSLYTCLQLPSSDLRANLPPIENHCFRNPESTLLVRSAIQTEGVEDAHGLGVPEVCWFWNTVITVQMLGAEIQRWGRSARKSHGREGP